MKFMSDDTRETIAKAGRRAVGSKNAHGVWWPDWDEQLIERTAPTPRVRAPPDEASEERLRRACMS
jgi:hypothetical protein